MTTRALQWDMFLAGIMDSDGNPLASGTLTFYAAGTSTLKNVYSDKAKTTPYTSRTLDSTGRVQIYGDGYYKVVVKDSSGTGFKTYDNLWIQSTNYYSRTVTGNTTATVEDDFIMCNTNGGTITVTLMEIADGGVTHPLNIKRNGSNTVVIDGGADETVDGSATYTISTDKRTVQLISDGTNWQISSVPVAALWDADEDTGIQVEESADEDKVRIDTGGTQRLLVDSAGLTFDADGDILPDEDNKADLGSSSKEFKDGYFDGTIYIDAMDADGTALTAAELQQLATIGATTISANQWSTVGSMAETLTGTELNILDELPSVRGYVQRPKFRWKDGDEIYIGAGAYHHSGTSEQVVYWNSELTFVLQSGGSNALSDDYGADGWHYIYLDDSAIVTQGAALLDADCFLNETTAPAWSVAKKGWYNGNDRCIFACYETGGAILSFYHDGSDYIMWDEDFAGGTTAKTDADYINQTPSDTWDDVYFTNSRLFNNGNGCYPC